MLKYAAINTLFAMLITWVIVFLIWLFTKVAWLFILFIIIAVFIWFCFDYNDKGNED